MDRWNFLRVMNAGSQLLSGRTQSRRFVAVFAKAVKRAAMQITCFAPAKSTHRPRDLVALIFARHRLHKIDDRAAHFGVGNLGKSLVEFEPLAAAQKLNDITFGRLFSKPSR